MQPAHNIGSLVSRLVLISVVACLTSSTLHAKKNQNGVGPGNELVYYFASSLDLEMVEVQSNGTDSKQLVFRGAQIDFDAITSKCVDVYDTLDGSGDGKIIGTLVLQPKSNTNPFVATLTFWFDAPLPLDNYKEVTHRLYMEGEFDPESAWPPTDSADLSFISWEVAAENKKAQRSDCDDDGVLGTANAYEVHVRHE